ncbi:MAG: PD40 domain-containing protein [Bacteroidales bacterium]|nr:PD40 domain-containing protein [Bacteroidales bacterium]
MKRLILILTLILPLIVFSQENGEISTNDKVMLAEDLIDDENFSDAIRLYNKLLEMDSTNSDLNFKLGFCYLNTSTKKDMSIVFFERSIENLSLDKKKKKFNAPDEVFYYLGKAYQVNGEYEKAIEVLNRFKIKLEGKDKEFEDAIDRLILRSQNALELVNNPVNMSIKNIGPIINSDYTDHSPVFSADEEMLIFTSRRDGSLGGKLMRDGEYYEDLYIAYKDEDGNWGVPRNMGKPINTTEHEASVSLSPDGNKLFIYNSEENGSIYVSDFDGEDWSKPQKLGLAINTKSRETSASISVDGNSIFFTSDRKGGFGGLDIYTSRKLPNGDWGEARNLGSTVNTEFDEEGPYIHPDGKTLYFSSKGHKNMGGFDIFTSSVNEFGTWDLPVNIGYPINTTGDDVFFVPSIDKKRAYYASFQAGGFGHSDIYLMDIPNQEGNNITLLRGQIAICTGKVPSMSITARNVKTDEIVSIVRPNRRTGRFVLIFNQSGRYEVEYEVRGKIVNSELLNINNNQTFGEITKVIKLKSGTPCDATFDLLSSEEAEQKMLGEIFYNGQYFDEQIEIKNILFPFGQAKPIESNASLDVLADYLIFNDDAKVEIGAFADAVGSDVANIRITQRRAQVVINYLVAKGVKREQLKPIGYGESNPIAVNKNLDGTWNKDAQKYNRRIEFRVLKQGIKKLLIKPMTDIPEKYKNKDYIWKN